MSVQDPDLIFAKIARRYDLLNAIISFGRAQAWRRKGADELPDGRVLDLGSGTGAAAGVFGDREVVALDPVPEMLRLSPIPERVVGVGEDLPFEEGTFDGVFSAYVFRNLDSVDVTIAEVARVLRPGGRLVVVGLGRPRNRFLASLHRMGSAIVLPVVGALVGAAEEYRYLHRSLDKLPPPEEMFAGQPLRFDRVWRMGPLGFVYGVALTKE